MRKNIIIISMLGIGLGLFTSFGQTYLPDPFKQLANSYSIWLLCAFVCGMYVSERKLAIVSGALVQYLALSTYYALTLVRFSGSGFSISSNIIWLVGGTVVGPIVSLAGFLYSQRSKFSMYAISLIVGTILSESLYQFIQLRYVAEGLVFFVLGVTVAVILLWRYPSRTRTILPIIGCTALAYLGYSYVLVPIFS